MRKKNQLKSPLEGGDRIKIYFVAGLHLELKSILLIDSFLFLVVVFFFSCIFGMFKLNLFCLAEV